MPDCRDLANFCLEYLEGALAEEERTRFRAHLECCNDCVSFFETYRMTPTVTREALATQMPDSVRQSVRAFLRKRC